MEDRLLSDLMELKTFREIVEQRSLTAAAAQLGTSLAVVSKRLASLERRAGVRLIHRTTRRLAPTDEGLDLFDSVVRAIEAIEEGEERLAHGRQEAVGCLRVTAPVSFGRAHVTPLLGALSREHRKLQVALRLTDTVVDLVAGGYDLAIRIGNLPDSSAAMRKIADNRRLLVAAPAYLDRHGRPGSPQELAAHRLLGFGAGTPWSLTAQAGGSSTVANGFCMTCDNGDVVRDWAVAEHGIMMKSQIDVSDDLASGVLERVLPEWHGGEAPVIALYPSARLLPLKTRILLDALASRLAAS